MLQRKLVARGMSGGRRVHRVLGTEAKMISPGISLSGQLTLLLSGWLYSQIPCTSRIAGHFEPKPSHVQSRRKWRNSSGAAVPTRVCLLDSEHVPISESVTAAGEKAVLWSSKTELGEPPWVPEWAPFYMKHRPWVSGRLGFSWTDNGCRWAMP